MERNHIILGGYGNIGSMIARFLIEKSNVHVIVAGRRYTQAQAEANKYGERATAREIDVGSVENYDNVLTDVDLVVTCFDLPDDRFPRACLERSINYVDISAEPDVLSSCQLGSRYREPYAALAVWIPPALGSKGS